MHIRAWFGAMQDYESRGQGDESLDRLLRLYAQAIMRYFTIINTINMKVTLNAASSLGLSVEQHKLIEWFDNKGISQLKLLAEATIPNDEQLLAIIDYERFILQQEMAFDYPEDVRATCIHIATELPQVVYNAIESAVALEEGYIEGIS
ncbi:hypothetical protein IC620_00180 [Hazenella sp. IB182357]|uniref:Uncharacterized protein n=1 Tax=Polycladospora coralii TaxID=2771432 RepID=A0A926N760_9BACL|nr:hypothetical protein [Polycladospora coralii]MBD1370777.1 hypothetical protein [Polycladospora coralii]MBS7529715.1 hypothetical protein [Polycladospora coralii]